MDLVFARKAVLKGDFVFDFTLFVELLTQQEAEDAGMRDYKYLFSIRLCLL
jgi:hypothetical protein